MCVYTYVFWCLRTHLRSDGWAAKCLAGAGLGLVAAAGLRAYLTRRRASAVSFARISRKFWEKSWVYF